MSFSLPKKYNNKIVKAIAEFDLIENGDNILVGVSGGKDSTFLLYSLAVLKSHLNLNFDLEAIKIDLGFENEDNQQLKKICHKLDINLIIKETKISEYILNEDIENPCSKCAYFRKGAMVQFMKENGFNKIALGHHYDDAVETFLMSIIYSGQLKTFKPKQFLAENKVYIIRPLVYLREARIVEAKNLFNYSPQKSPCPQDGKSKREEVREKFKELFNNKQLFYNIVAAMREGSTLELWPEALSDDELGEKIKSLWED